mgnify:CR=1 FL=1
MRGIYSRSVVLLGIKCQNWRGMLNLIEKNKEKEYGEIGDLEWG